MGAARKVMILLRFYKKYSAFFNIQCVHLQSRPVAQHDDDKRVVSSFAEEEVSARKQQLTFGRPSADAA